MNLTEEELGQLLPAEPKQPDLREVDWHAVLGIPKATDLAAPNMMANPDQAAKAMKIAPDAGLSSTAANANFKLAEEQAKRTRSAAAINDSPALQQWIEQSDNPLVTSIANDDYEKLGSFEKAMAKLGGVSPKPFGQETVEHGVQAYEAANYGRAASMYALGDVSQERALREFEQRPRPSEAPWYDLPSQAAELLGGLASNMAHGGTKAAVAGGLLGAAGGPAGVAAGAAIGLHAGTIFDMSQTAYGQSYRVADQWRDSNGQPMGEWSKQTVAIASGALTGVVGGIAGPQIGRAFSGSVMPFLMRAFGDKAVEVSLGRAAGNLAQAGITGGALNVGLELAQTLPFEVARAMGSDPHSLLADPTRAIEYAENLGKSFGKGALLFGTLAGLPIGANLYMDRARIRQTEADAAARDVAFQHAVESLTRERSPETFADFAQFTGGDDTHINAAAVAKLRETDPTAFDYVPDVDRKIAEALPHNGDLVVPTHEYFARTGEDHHAAIAADIRSGTGLTLNEAKELEKAWVAYHGSGATFGKFDSKFRLTGEGNNVYGAGHYVAERKGIAQSYYEQLAEREYFVGGEPLDESNSAHVAAQYVDKHEGNTKDAIDDLRADLARAEDIPSDNPLDQKYTEGLRGAIEHIEQGKPVESIQEKLSGNLYQVRVLADPKRMLHWDKPLGEQTPEVRAAIESTDYAYHAQRQAGDAWQDRLTGGQFMQDIVGDAPSGSARLRDAGLHGIQYYDAASRTKDPAQLAERIEELKADLAREKELLQEAQEQNSAEPVDPTQQWPYHIEKHTKSIASTEKTIAKLEEELKEPRTHNLVIFHDEHLEITHVNGVEVPKKVAESPLGQTLIRQINDTTSQVRKALWLDPIIVPEAAGLSKAAFARWSKHLQETQRAATKAAFDIAAREIKRRETPLWKNELANIGEEVANEFDSRPDFVAERLLRGKAAGEFGDFKTKFSAADVDELFSAAEQTAMGASPSKLLRPDLIGKGETLHPDVMAGLSGHGSGKELISELINLERDRRERGETPGVQYKRMLREEAARRMEERHGKLGEMVIREAMDLAMNVEQVQVLHDDMQKIVQSGELPIKLDLDMVRRDAIETLSAMPAKEAAKTKLFEMKAALEGNNALNEATKGNWAEAFRHKQAQFRNFLMARASKGIARDLATTERLIGQMQELTKDTWEQQILDGAHALLREISVKTPRSTENLMQALADQSPDVLNFATFVKHQKEARGLDILPMPDGFPTDYKDATAAQIGYLRQVLDSVAFHARDQQKIALGEQQEAFNSVMDSIYSNMDSMATKWKPDEAESFKEWAKGHGRNFDAMLLRMEQLAAWFDKNDPLGPFTSAVIRPIKTAQHAKDAMLRSFAEDFTNLPASKGWTKSLDQKITNTVLMDLNGDPMRVTRGRLVAMILNMGNEQNMRTLVQGRKWDEGTLREFVRANARKEDYDFAQGVWDMLDKYWDDVAEAGKRNTGVRPERVQPLRLDTEHGAYRGGYYPLIREMTWEPITKLERIFADGDVSPQVYQASAMRARTGAVYPVELSLDRLPSNLRNLAHTIHYTEPVRNAYKVLSDPAFRNLVSEKFGPEYKDLFYPWLKDIAQDGGRPDSRAEKWLANISGVARANAVYMLIGWRPSTALIHGGAALSNSVYEVGPVGLAKAAKDIFVSTPEDILGATDSMFRNPQNLQSTWAWAMEQSGELRNRNHNLDRDIRREQDKVMVGKTDWRAINAYHASWMVSTLDIASAVPTWIAEYKAQRLEGRGHDDAVYIADRAVRQAHGSSGLPDQPQIQRMGDVAKWFTTFYGYFNHNYNRQRDTGRMLADVPRLFREEGMASALGTTGKAFAQSLAYLLVPAIIHEAVRPHAKEDEGWGWWATKASLMQLASGVPFLRDAAQAFLTGQAPRTAGPMGELLTGVLYNPLKDLSNALDPEKEVSKDAVKHLLEIPGWIFGYPMSRYLAGQGQYIWDRAMGNETGDNITRLMLEGNPNERKQH